MMCFHSSVVGNYGLGCTPVKLCLLTFTIFPAALSLMVIDYHFGNNSFSPLFTTIFVFNDVSDILHGLKLLIPISAIGTGKTL